MKNVVLCIRYEGSDYRREIQENIGIKDLVREKLSGYTERKMEIFDSAARETVCIVFLENGENMEVIVRNIISRLNVEIFYFFGMEVKIGAGNMVDSIYETADSYRQAKDVIRYRENVGSNVYLYSELTQVEEVYYYPREFDELLYNYVVAGKAENAREMIWKLYRENMERNSGMLSVTAIERLKKRLEECVSSVAEKYGILSEELVTGLGEEQNIKKYFTAVCDLIDRITGEIGEKTGSVQGQLVTRIVDYINMHYSENTLCLKQIAHVFGFQEKYISKLFKTTYGENMSDVIEKVRMEQACGLLQTTEIRISDLSAMVGYNSDISFRRAFKKVTGVTPGEYREVLGK